MVCTQTYSLLVPDAASILTTCLASSEQTLLLRAPQSIVAASFLFTRMYVSAVFVKYRDNVSYLDTCTMA